MKCCEYAPWSLPEWRPLWVQDNTELALASLVDMTQIANILFVLQHPKQLSMFGIVKKYFGNK
jgi:hypothetical protein